MAQTFPCCTGAHPDVKQHHAATLLAELAGLDGGGREEERTLETGEEGPEDAAELAGEEGGGTEEVEENEETEEAEDGTELVGHAAEHCALVPVQHWLLAELQTVVADRNASVGHVAELPEQFSATSHAPATARHTCVLGAKASCGQVAEEPLHFSSASQAPAEARQTVDAGANVSAEHVAEVPEHVSATSQAPAATRHCVLEDLNVQSALQHAPLSQASPASTLPLPQLPPLPQSCGQLSTVSIAVSQRPLPQAVPVHVPLLHVPTQHAMGPPHGDPVTMQFAELEEAAHVPSNRHVPAPLLHALPTQVPM